ncbi:MAG: hypothetical protein ACRD0P_31175, partial [Stackebrandtia sp.]
YLHHAAAALAAQWRVDAAVDTVVARQWWGRTGAVCVCSLVLSAGIAGLAGQPLPVASTVLVVAGIGGTLAVCFGLVVLVHRR